MLSSASLLVTLSILLVTLLANQTTNNGILIKCLIRDEHQLHFLQSLLEESANYDMWDHEIKALPSEVTIRVIGADAIGKLRENLSCGKEAGDIGGFFGSYQRYSDIDNKISSSMINLPQFSDLKVSVAQIAQSHENRSIKVVKISTDPSSRVLWIGCGQHAREWIAPAACLYLIEKLTKNYGQDARITEMLKGWSIHVAPLLNPDGYEYSMKVNRYWRKNRRRNGDGSYGVDLNRNWANRWGSVGTSGRPPSDIYRGPSPGSEPEINQTSQYILSIKNLAAGLDVHSYGEWILRNYGWTTNPCPDENYFASLGEAMETNMNSKYNSNYEAMRSGALYPAAGSMDDWLYEQGKVPGMTLEMRDKGTYGFLLPASQIIPTGEELLEAVLTLSEQLK